MEYIDLKSYIKKLGKNWLILLLCCLIGGIGAFIYSKFVMTPMYASQIRINVSDSDWGSSGSVTVSKIEASKYIIKTAAVLLKDDYSIEKIGNKISEYVSLLSDSPSTPTEQAEANLKKKLSSLTKGQLRNSLSFSSEADSIIMIVTSTTSDPEVSRFICNAVAAASPDIIKEFIPSAQLKTVGEASFSSAPVSPRIARNVIIGVIGSLAVVCVIFFVILMFDNKISDEESFKNKFKNINVLGVIPNLDELRGVGYGNYGKYGKYGK